MERNIIKKCEKLVVLIYIKILNKGDNGIMRITTEYVIHVGGREYAKYQDLKEAKLKLEKAKKENSNCWVCLHEIERKIISEEWIELSKKEQKFQNNEFIDEDKNYCPKCKSELTPRYYKGYYDEFPYWECQCNDKDDFFTKDMCKGDYV